VSDPTTRPRIWVRSCQKPTAKLSPLKSTNLIGANQGNLLYQFSTYRALTADGVDLSTISYRQFDHGPVEERAERINTHCDHLVLPLSSSFRLQNLENLDRWADLIERLTIPVTVVGIGAQLRLQDVEDGTFLPSRVTGVTASTAQIAAHEAAARRFVQAVLERSSTIGVRGEVSKRYLEYLGVAPDRIDVIGCPSLFTWGPDFQAPTTRGVKLGRRSAISLSFDHRIDDTADLLDRTIDEHPRSVVYMQERLGARMVITGEETRADWAGDDRFPVRTTHRLFDQRRLEYFPTGWSWIRHLGTYDFAYGPRLHGTVAAVLSGTPAHLLVHDSRTLEVAQHHHLPHSLTRDVDASTTARGLAADVDYSAFNAAYRDRFDAFVDFLERNGLRSAYRDGSGAALAAFDASIEPAAAARGVISGAPRRRTARQLAGTARRRLVRQRR
jgi:hypothetical protein